MTLHIITTTPNHIVVASDRLLFVPQGHYIELSEDRYKHFVLICDDAKAIISFTGFAGIPVNGGVLDEDTIHWLREILLATSKKSHSINNHINDIAKQAQYHINYLKKKYRLNINDCALAIIITGWCQEGSFNCIIENYQNRQCIYDKVRNEFKVWIRKYFDPDAFANGPKIMMQGQRALADKQTSLLTGLEQIATLEKSKKIFDASVRLIRAVANVSSGTVGHNCSGIRMSRNDPGIEVFNDRDEKVWDSVMPDTVMSTSAISGFVGGIRGRNLSK